MVQIKCLGDEYSDFFSQGRTMRNSSSTISLKYADQKIIENPGCNTVITSLISPRGYTCEHILTHHTGQSSVEIETVVKNTSDSVITLEMLSSFSLGFITPFDFADAAERLRIHRIRSSWSAEGRLDSRTLEDMHLERSWIGWSAVSERFGQIGSMPVRGFFPFIAVEDIQKKVIWGVQLACAASWQLEVYRRDDYVCLSGGLADREFGQWLKAIKPGEKFKTPKAILTTCQGNIDLCCQRLTASHERELRAKPKVEADLPVVMNEWCISWGSPTHENVIAIADKIKRNGIKYLVIDAGWYRKPGAVWGRAHGDWLTDKEFFPQGLEATAQAVRDRGLIPGLWFEMETVGPESAAYSLTDHLLKRDGFVLSSGSRRFWDFRDPWVIDYLSDRVIGLLKKCGFGYVKIDYNETIGIGADDNDSLGEGLRSHIDAVQMFFKKMQSEIPDLVIENCSSGGHRNEPSMMAIASMASFSDAHECPEIPIIAANLHRMILPRQSQIWAVLRAKDTLQRTCYSLAAAFLGRMCISGDISVLPQPNWKIMTESISLYETVADVIRSGVSTWYGPEIKSYRHPKGWQAILRTTLDHSKAIVVFHSFSNPIPHDITFKLPLAKWQCVKVLTAGDLCARIENDTVHIIGACEYDSCVLYLTTVAGSSESGTL
jgi:alpha-galactosidase